MKLDPKFADLCPRCGGRIDWAWRDERNLPWRIALMPRMSGQFGPDMDLGKPADLKMRLYCSKRCADADVRDGYGRDDPPKIVDGCYEEKVDHVIDLLVKNLKYVPDREKAEELRKLLKGDGSE